MPKYTISRTEADVAKHWKGFTDYVALETATGGPDPHLKFLGHLIDEDDVDDRERLWRILCYVGCYNTAGAQVVWQRFPHAGGPPTIKFVSEHWTGIPLRKERRPVRSREKLTQYFTAAHGWVERYHDRVRSMSYDELWDALDDDLFGVGRYIGMRFLEALRLHYGAEGRMYDLRPRGGWGSKLTVTYLYPEFDEQLNRSPENSRNNATANAIGREIKDALEDDYGIALDWYTLETLLCNYRQALGKGKYPGAPHDSELEYAQKAVDYWNDGFDLAPMLRARAAMFPHRCLGELNGWHGQRKELYGTRDLYGFFWSDLVYSYHHTVDIANPVRWSDVGGGA